MNRVASIVCWLIVVAGLGGVVSLYVFARVERVVFEGTATERAIVNEIVAVAGRGADMAAIAETLRAELDWVRDVRVRYRWPDTVEVGIDREAIAARWAGGAFVTAEGKIIRDFVGTGQPNVLGLAVMHASVEDARVAVEVYRSIRDLAQPIGGVSAVRAQGQGDWIIELDTGLRIVVHQETRREEFERFLAVFEAHLEPVVGRIAQVDARYDAGVAVQWKSGAEILAINVPAARGEQAVGGDSGR